MSNYDYLTGVLSEIAEVAGLDAALKVAEAKGGVEAHFPARAPDGHWLVEATGREAADKICAYFRCTQRGGVRLLVPLGPHKFWARARRKAAQLCQEGVSAAKAAQVVGVHTRSVWRYRARMRDREDKDQGSLF